MKIAFLVELDAPPDINIKELEALLLSDTLFTACKVTAARIRLQWTLPDAEEATEASKEPS